MLLNTREVGRLAARIECVVTVQKLEEFTSCDLARALSVDGYDILFTLHQMPNFERATRSADATTDCWRVKRPVYTFERVVPMPLTENHK